VVFMEYMIPQVKVARLRRLLVLRAFQPAGRYVGMPKGLGVERALLARNNGDIYLETPD
jgi:hypothetical protein